MRFARRQWVILFGVPISGKVVPAGFSVPGLWNSGFQNKRGMVGRNEGNNDGLEQGGEPGRLCGMLHKRQLTRQTAEMLVVVGQFAIGESRPRQRHSEVQLGAGEQRISS